MRDWKGSRRAAVLALTLALVTLGATRDADAHPPGRVVVRAGFYGWGPWYGYGFGLGWGPYWGWGPGPYYYGYPTYLWLADGGHHLQVYKDGFKLFDEQIDVRRGMRSELKIKLEPGESQPPGPKPGDKSSIDKPKEEKSKDDKPKEEKPKDDQPKGDQERSER